jgi:hypothetical protein
MFTWIHDSLGVARASRKALLILCFAAGVACRADAAGTSTQNSPASSPGFDSSFAIADFDGDRKPDLATVELQTSSSSRITLYSIRLQLATGAAQVFGVTAPAGGLQIMARDVNGDSAMDVLVTSGLQHKQVAVLLNDGHGKFTLADGSAFPAAIRENSSRWNCGAIPLCDSGALLRMEYPTGEMDREGKFDGPQGQFERAHTSISAASTCLSLFSLLGRAPPANVFQS